MTESCGSNVQCSHNNGSFSTTPIFIVINGTDNTGDGQFKFVSDYVAFLFDVVVYACLSGCISFVGVFANITNIIVFVRQGVFNESSSVSLLGLAVSDLCSVLTMLWMSIGFSVVLADPKGLSWVPYDVAYLTAIWPHIISAQITRMVTAYVALERCICVVFPFKVKRLFTPKRSLIVVVCIFTYCLLSYSPVFVVHQLQYQIDPSTNSSRLMLVVTKYRQLVVDIVSYINSVVFNIGSVAMVLFCTMITVSRVNLSKAWRDSTASYGTKNTTEIPTIKNTESSHVTSHDNNTLTNVGDETNNQSSDQKVMKKTSMIKEKKLVRMITLISVIFLVCYCPDLSFLIMISVNPEINVTGQQSNLAHLMYSLTFLMESINSSINIVVYFHMSSKYNQEFKKFFGDLKKKITRQ